MTFDMNAILKTFARYLFWAGLWVLLTVLVFNLMDFPRLKRLRMFMDWGIRTQGEIVALYPQEPASARYVFKDGAERVEARSMTRSLGSEADALRVGQVVPVVYVRKTPRDSMLGNPREVHLKELIACTGASALFSSLIMLVFSMVRGRSED